MHSLSIICLFIEGKVGGGAEGRRGKGRARILKHLILQSFDRNMKVKLPTDDRRTTYRSGLRGFEREEDQTFPQFNFASSPIPVPFLLLSLSFSLLFPYLSPSPSLFLSPSLLLPYSLCLPFPFRSLPSSKVA